jgi:hypothetical protein
LLKDGIIGCRVCSWSSVLSLHLLLCCFVKNILALKSEREFALLVGVSCMKRRKIEELSKEEEVLVA